METKLFYLISLTIPGMIAYYAKVRTSRSERKLLLLFTTAIYFFFLAFTTGYSDLAQYKYHFETSAEFIKYVGYYFRHYRLTFFTFNALIRLFTDDFWVYNAIWAFVISVIMFVVFKELLDLVNVSWSVLAFSMVFFLHLISGKRFTLAFAFIMLGMVYYAKKKNMKFLICIIIAATFHISTLLILLFWGADIILSNGFFKENCWFVLFFSIIVIVSVIVLRKEWMSVVTYINDSGYAAGKFVLELDFGIGWLMYWVPGLLIYYISRPYIDKCNRINYLTAIGITMAISSIGFMVYGLARVNVLLIFVDVYWIPYAFKQLEEASGTGSNAVHWNLVIIKFCYAGYLLFRFFLYMSSMAYSSKIIPYQNIFGITI